jgi:hypothetical protein
MLVLSSVVRGISPFLLVTAVLWISASLPRTALADAFGLMQAKYLTEGERGSRSLELPASHPER